MTYTQRMQWLAKMLGRTGTTRCPVCRRKFPTSQGVRFLGSTTPACSEPCAEEGILLFAW